MADIVILYFEIIRLDERMLGFLEGLLRLRGVEHIVYQICATQKTLAQYCTQQIPKKFDEIIMEQIMLGSNSSVIYLNISISINSYSQYSHYNRHYDLMNFPIDPQMLQIFFQRRIRATQTLRSIHLSKCPTLEQDVASLDKELIHIFYRLFTKDENPQVINMLEVLPFKEKKTPMPVCNKLFTLKDFMFRCYDCTIHEAAVLCVDCFENGDHKGHRFTKFSSGGGNCDCGNPDAVSPAGFCSNHREKPEGVEVESLQMDRFCSIVRQIFMWALMLHQLKLKLECEMLMAHLMAALSHLNNQSLVYNAMTDYLLFEGEAPLISHILTIGSESSESILGKNATELFLNMFSLPKFKQKLAVEFIKAYNKLYRFQSSKFQSLFIQIFANNDLVEKVINNTHISLDPRDRMYDSYIYYNNLIFMGSIRERSARIFFIPIIERGGIHCQLLDKMIKQSEHGAARPEQIYGECINQQHLFYMANKVMIKLIKNEPDLIWMEIANNYKKLVENQFKKNKVLIIPHRLLAILFFAYYKGDFSKIDVQEIKDRLSIQDFKFKNFLKKLTIGFLGCLKEMGYFLSSNDFGGYNFQYYIDIYCRSSVGSKVILLDMLGLKFCAMAYSKYLQVPFDRNILATFQTDLMKQAGYNIDPNADWRVMEQQPQYGELSDPNRIKSKPRSVYFYMGWINTLNLMMEAIIVDRSEVYLANQLEMTDIPLLKEMELNQLKRLMLNVRESTMHDMESIGFFWFSKLLDKNLLAQVANYDKTKKKYVIRPEITGAPIKIEFLKSFVKTPDHFMRRIDANSLEINDETRRWRELMFPQKMLENIYKGLYQHLKDGLEKDHNRYLREMALHLRAMNFLFENQSQALTNAIKQVKKLAKKTSQETEDEILGMFQKDNRSKSIQKQMGKQQQEKRLQMLRKKKQQKKKAIKQKSQVSKYLTGFSEKEAKIEETCIICHEDSIANPTFYLSSIFLSNIMFSTLKIEGENPYFTTCFHVIHEKCFSQFFKKDESNCPFCTAFTNILLPTEEFLDHQESVDLSVQKMLGAIEKLHERKIEKIYKEMMKSLVQFYFSGIVDEGLVNQKQTKLFFIILRIIVSNYNLWTTEEKSTFFIELFQFSDGFQQQSKIHYNIGLLIRLVFSILQQYFQKKQITQSYLKQLLFFSKALPKHDLKKFLFISGKLLGCEIDNQSILQSYIDGEEVPQLQGYIHSYDPPKTIKALLQQRSLVYSQGICKTGHNICICLICCWKGCYDCGFCTTHTTLLHNRETLFFNYTTGGLYYYFNNSIILLRPLYVNDLGLSWEPKFQQSSYFFEIDVYNKMIQALRGGYLIHLVRANYQNLRITKNIYRTY